MRNTIKNHKDFQTERNCPYASTDLFSIRTRNAKFVNDPRYGLVVTKKKFRFAVQRNRAKRLLRDWIYFSREYMCPELDYVVFAHTKILCKDVTREIGRAKMIDAFKEIKQRYESHKQ